jgi:hypothetical protein
MSKLYNLQQIKLALLTGFMSVRRSGDSARHSGTFRMTLAEGTPNQTQIEFDAWVWELQEKDQEKWLSKDKKRTLDYCPSMYIGAESKQKAEFFIDPVEALMGEHEIDSGKGSQESALVVEQDTTDAGRAKTRAKMEAAIRPDEIDECEKEAVA